MRSQKGFSCHIQRNIPSEVEIAMCAVPGNPRRNDLAGFREVGENLGMAIQRLKACDQIRCRGSRIEKSSEMGLRVEIRPMRFGEHLANG